MMEKLAPYRVFTSSSLEAHRRHHHADRPFRGHGHEPGDLKLPAVKADADLYHNMLIYSTG